MRRPSERHRHGGIVAPGFLMHVMAALVLLLCVQPAAAPAAGAPTSTCPAAGTERAAIADIDERLEITLRDGRTLRLAGLEPPRPTPDGPDFDIRARDALRRQAGGEIAFLPLASAPDRWGRLPVFAFFGAPAAPGALVPAGPFLLARGFARFMPEPAAHPCRTDFLAAEAVARSASLGLWRDPFYAVLAAGDSDAFAERAATNVIVEGRLIAVDAGPLRTNLRFTPGRGFSVTILQRNVKIFERAGWDFHALIGRKLRIRGLLDLRFGPQIEVSDTDQIELVPEADGGLQARPEKAQ